MDPVVNFGLSTVATAPSPATTGTSLVLDSGDGALFPDPSLVGPYNLVVKPANAFPNSTNSEIIRVTTRVGDTLTVVRSQEGTSARSIIVGDEIYMSPTKKLIDDISTQMTQRTPAGVIMAWVGSVEPSGWFLCDGNFFSQDEAPDLFKVLVPLASTYGYYTPDAEFTASNATDTLTSVGHTLADGDMVHLTSNGTLPSGLSAAEVYYVVNVSGDNFQLATTKGGGAIDFTTDGTGPHYFYTTLLTPDLSGRVIVGRDAGQTEFDTLNEAGGSKTHTLSTAEMPTHSHGISDPSHRHSLGDIRVNEHCTGSDCGWKTKSASSGSSAYTNYSGTGIRINNSGSGNAHNNLQPYRVLNYIIKK